MKRIYVLLLAVLLMMALPFAAFAGGAAEEPPEPDEEFNFYMVTHGGAADPFWAVVIRGAEDAAERFGVNLTYLGPEVADIGEFVNMLETAVDARPDGIAVTITDPDAVEEPLRRAIEEYDIPVVALNVPDERERGERIPYLSYVGADEYQVGVQAARRMLEEFTPQAGVVLIHEPGHSGLERRAQGISDVFGEEGIAIERLSGRPDAAENYEVLEAYLIANENVDAVFTLGPQGAHPSLAVLADLPHGDGIRLGAVDLTDEMISAIDDGRMLFTIEQQQYLQGYLPIGLLTLYNLYGLIPHDDILTGPAIVDLNNVDIVRAMVEAGYR